MDLEKQGKNNYYKLMLTNWICFDTIIIVRKQLPSNSRPKEFLTIIKIVKPLDFIGLKRHLYIVANSVCKTFIPRFKSGCRLQKIKQPNRVA